MENKKITYIVFKNYNKASNSQEGIVFFEDGTYEKVDRQILINYLEKYAKQENITNKKDLFYNNDRIINLDNTKDEKEIITKLTKESKIDNIIDGLDDKIEKQTQRQLQKEDKIIDDIEDIRKENSVFNRFKKKSKVFKVTVTAIGISAILALGNGVYTIIKDMSNKNDDKKDTDNNQEKFTNLSYQDLLQRSQSAYQKREMTKVGQFLDIFNIDFANRHKENNKNIKASLTWDEVLALNLTYNNYTKEQIEDIFNGENENSNSLDLKKFTEAYKQSIVELTKAFVIEDQEVKIDLDNLINEPEGKAFYAKYHRLFEKCKKTTGKTQIDNVNDFYKELAKDFPIDKNNNISIENIESYKLSILPMVSASEILFQNLEIDNTLSKEAITYFNNLDLNNYVNNKFSEYEAIILVSKSNKKSPYYNLFKEQKILELEAKNQYYIDNEIRDLSKLTVFNDILSKNNPYSEAYMKNQETELEHNTTNQQSSSKNNIEYLQQEIDNIINKENEQEKASAEKKAQEKEKELQNKENDKKEKLKQEVKKENDKTKDTINKINEKINDDKTVDEKDYEEVIIIDDEYTDDDKNLDDCVIDITTDKDDTIDETLPQLEEETRYSDQNIIETETELTDEQIADMIIKSMTEQKSTDSVKVYTK